MTILVITNLYPPDDRGGYALGCRKVVESLRARGHRVHVLTATPQAHGSRGDENVHRWLSPDDPDNAQWRAVFLKELVNQPSFKMLCRDVMPDRILAFDLSRVSVSLASLAREMGLPVCFYVASDWLATWERDRWYQIWSKADGGFKMLRFLSRRFDLRPSGGPLDFAQVMYASRHLERMVRRVGKTTARSSVIPWGVDVRRFSCQRPAARTPARLLYVGQIKPQKGIDVAIRALGLLKHEPGAGSRSLTIAGDDRVMPEYVDSLRDLAASCGVLDEVTFSGFVRPEDMPGLYQAHDVFVFPSVVVEPLTVSLLEAMSCGLGTVSTATGGNCEVLLDESNALVIPKENPEACARQVLRLLQEPELLTSLGARARQTVEKEFSFDRFIASLESFVDQAAGEARLHRRSLVSGERSQAARGSRPELIDEIVARGVRWVRWGGVLVRVRQLLKPGIAVKVLRKIYRDSSSMASLLLFPVLCNGLFYLTRRPHSLDKGRTPQPRHVLVVQLADLGDVILTSPFLRELRRFLPRAKIVLAVQPAMVDVLRHCPYVDELVPYDWRTVKGWRTALNGNARWWWKSLRTSKRFLWKYPLDTAISLRWNRSDPCQAASLILMTMSGASRRVAYVGGTDDSERSSSGQVDRLITEGPVRGAPRHEVEYQLDILRFLGAQPEETTLEVWTSPEDESFARDILEHHGLAAGDLLVGFAPGAAWVWRRWPAERFAALGQWLQQDYGAHILIVAGESERDLAHRIAGGLLEGRTINLAGQTTLRQMASVLKRCRLFIGNDSGPLHVAAASGVPAVGLFGPGEYERFKPWGPDHEVIRLGLTCNPCRENCWFDDGRCVQGLTVDQVKEILSEKLEHISK